MKRDVFISYKTGTNDGQANAVCNVLEAYGFGCWIAPRNVLAGEDWQQSITRALNECSIVVVIFSRTADMSPDIATELTMAIKRGRRIIPFRVEDVEPANLEYALASKQWFNAFPPPIEPHARRLAECLQSLPEIGAHTGNYEVEIKELNSHKKSASDLQVATGALIVALACVVQVEIWPRAEPILLFQIIFGISGAIFAFSLCCYFFGAPWRQK